MAETLTFNMDAVLQRLLEECYSLLAALPLCAVSEVCLWGNMPFSKLLAPDALRGLER